MKISPEQLKLYAVTDRSWLKPDETLASVTEAVSYTHLTLPTIA